MQQPVYRSDVHDAPVSTLEPTPQASRVQQPTKRSAAPRLGFALVMIFMVLDYGRPQDRFPLLGMLHLSMLVSAILLVVLFSNNERIPWYEIKIRLFGVLLIFMAIWGPFATNNYWALQTFNAMLVTMIFVVAFLTFVDTRERLRAFTILWIATTVFQGLWGITHKGRGTGSFIGDENDFALVMNMMIPLALFVSRDVRKPFQKAACFGAIGIYVAGVVASASRGGFVGLVAVGGTLMLMSRNRIRIFLITGVIGLALAAMAPREYFREMSTITDTQDSTRLGRLKQWRISRQIFYDNPVFGIGQGNIGWRFGEWEEFDNATEPSLAGPAVHSFYFTVLTELGTFGVLIYLSLVVSAVRDCRSSMRGRGREPPPALDPYARGVLCAMAGFFAGSLFISTLYYPHLYYLLAMSAAVRRISMRAETSAANP